LRPFNSFASSSALVLAALVGCNLHSGSGIDPDEYLEGGSEGGSGSGSSSGNSGGGSGSGSGGAGPDGAEPDDAGSTTPGNDATTFDTGPGEPDTGNPVNPGQCPGEPTLNACVDCCGSIYPTGYEQFVGDLEPCLCTDAGSGACAAECAGEVCAGQLYSSTDDACEACVNQNTQPGDLGGSSCFMQFMMQCKNDQDCQQFMGCRFGCPQGGQ
jgi:hypothetical protein